MAVGISDCGTEGWNRKTGMSRRSISKQVSSVETELDEEREGGEEAESGVLATLKAKVHFC